MPQYLYKGRLIRPDPDRICGEGGEAIVYNLGNGEAVKLYRQPNDRYFLDIPDPEQKKRDLEGAIERLALIQQKLPAFPKKWSDRVVVPTAPVTNRARDCIVGYGMPLLTNVSTLRDFAKRKTRPPGVDNSIVLQIHRDLHDTVAATHAAHVIIGDFNYFNVLVAHDSWRAFLIDSDSMQFGPFLCETFQSKFVDPLVCAPTGSRLIKLKGKPFSEDSDWYAFAAMLFETMLGVSLYGGTYEPRNPKQMVELDARPLQRIWVGHPEVIYPRVGVPLNCVDDDFLQFYHELVVKNRRGTFPRKLLDRLRWTTCSACGIEHCKPRCPACAQAAPAAAVRETVRGKVRAIRVLDRAGVILRASMQEGRLHYLLYRDKSFIRSSCRYDPPARRFLHDPFTVIGAGELNSHMRFALHGARTVIGMHGALESFSGEGRNPEILTVDSFRDEYPVFAANERHLYWISAGELLRSTDRAALHIGKVLTGQTRFWVGPSFGFGFYQAGQIQVSFVFDAERRGINDAVLLPPWGGQVVDTACYFDAHRCWFLAAVRKGSAVVNHCYTTRSDGTIMASAQAPDDDPSWLGSIHGKCAASLPRSSGGLVHVLFSAQDGGLVRVHEDKGTLFEAAHFPDTKGFVNAGHELLPAREGLYAVDRNGILCLQMQG